MKANRNIITILSICLCFATANLSAQKSTDTPVEGVQLNVYIPNAITPDGNGLNDLFKPVISGGEIEIYDLTIYDRTGKVIFHSEDSNQVWNGSISGSEYLTTSNMYIYFLKLKAVGGIDTKTYTGHVVTIR